ncbi:uncharacterized protein LOC119666646 [Teleopsis dalmanni]|uniref:uncharacterized protein LOC119666646 n=1 Tax=Teleopsis dalmanni TaxID=139649 RepID=UPI0018CF0490|nr:uncharacterized protein LOC119666646 [Teleopsis dalmanni]
MSLQSKTKTTVNCWFCNENTKVLYVESNSWTCPKCEQYNGFNKNGDCNRLIYEKYDCSNLTTNKIQFADPSSTPLTSSPQNGLCKACNEAQNWIVEKRAEFEPTKENRFDQEFKVYNAQLEKQYGLCRTCKLHVRNVLNEGKNLALGAKFLDYVTKRAGLLKEGQFTELEEAVKQRKKHKFKILIATMALLNIFCLLGNMTTIKRDILTETFGELLGNSIFKVLTHSIAFIRVLYTYMDTFSKYDIIARIGSFVRTLFMMLLYSMGLSMPDIVRLDFNSIYMVISPFTILCTALYYNLLDSLKLTRFTFLVALWAAFAIGLVSDVHISQNMLFFSASVLTVILTLTKTSDWSSAQHDSSTNSFHKIYSEYLSDEETKSFISDYYNSSITSAHSNRSYPTTTNYSTVTPSAPSINSFPRSQLSPTLSYRTCFTNKKPTSCSPNSSLNHNNSTPHNSTFRGEGLKSSKNILRESVLNLNRKNNENSLYKNSSFTTNPYGDTFIIKNNESNYLNSTLQHIDADNCNRVAHSPFSASNTALHQYNSYAEPLLKKNNHSFLNSTLQSMDSDVFSTRAESPFSVPNNTLHQQTQAHVVMPSPSNANTSWSSGGLFNRYKRTEQRATSLFHEPHNTIDNNDAKFSRSSSLSSGFESQIDRDNSACPDSVQAPHATSRLDYYNSFEPINGNYHINTTAKRNYEQPLSINCSSRAQSVCSELWNLPSNGRSINSQNSFNLRKINDVLPTYRRGDLLKKWKESQMTS